MDHIEPKPVTYRGINLKSTLEGRWAVYLDQCFPNQWMYEPFNLEFSSRGWRYTPDFVFKHIDTYYLLEVKPAEASEDYHAMLYFMLRRLRKFPTFYLAFGSFYGINTPSLHEFEYGRLVTTHLTPYSAGPFQYSIDHVIQAKNYRFDLLDSRTTYKPDPSLAKMVRHYVSGRK